MTLSNGNGLKRSDTHTETPSPISLKLPQASKAGKSVTYLSFGGGPPSAALLILNAQGLIEPKADLIVFADPGSEDPRTYRVLPMYEEYAAHHGIPFVRVTSNAGPLYDWVVERSVPIPAFTSKGLGRRQCTERWKIRPIHKLLRQELGFEKVTAQLAMTWDEVWRMRDSPTKYVTNIYPLIDHRLLREGCIEIIEQAGLPVPPRSACVFCPLKSIERWQETLEETPDSFDDAVKLEHLINVRQAELGRDPIFLTRKQIPLANLRQQWLVNGHDHGDDQDEGLCETGHCFT